MTTILVGSSIIKKWRIEKYYKEGENLGILGLRSRDLKKAYEKRLERMGGAKEMIIYVGSNDVTHNHDEVDTIKNIIEFLEKVMEKMPRTRIKYIGILKSPSKTEREKEKIERINRIIKRWIDSKRGSIYFYNVNRELHGTKNYIEDGHHLSEEGYYRLYKCIEGE